MTETDAERSRAAQMFDEQDMRSAEERERILFDRLPLHLAQAMEAVPGLARHLAGVDPKSVTSRDALAKLPVLRKPALMEAQKANPPFGDFVNRGALAGTRVFQSPGPVWEAQGVRADPWHAARALHAAGFRSGNLVLNALSYHMTPGGFIMDEGLRALGCTVFPAGIGNTDIQVEAAAHLRPVAYAGTPDFLKVILDRADEQGADLSSIRLAMVSGGALFPSLRAEYEERGVTVMQSYATADLGVIAYETRHGTDLVPGMIINEDMIVEIVRPGTGDPVEPGEVGEIVVTNFSRTYPLVRFGTGDMTKQIAETSPCGRTAMRIAGWMGRADQRTKVKGMFVDPAQVAQVVNAHDGVRAARLVVSREGERDAMVLQVTGEGIDTEAVAATLRDVTRLGGTVERVDALPNDGRVIADERDYEG